MNTSFKIPFYAKASLISTGIFTFISALYISQSILVPLIYATIVAIVLSPIVDFLLRKGFSRILAISIAIALMIITSALIIVLLVSQISLFSDSFPTLLTKLDKLLLESEVWISQNFNISTAKINAWISQTNNEILNNSRSAIGKTLITIGNLLVVILLIPVYIFMLLFYQPLLMEFIHKLFSHNKHETLHEVLTASKGIIQSYLVGLLIEAFIVAALNSASLLILGIQYAILLGVIGALLNVIPYIGGIIAVALPMFIALATKSPVYALLVMVSYLIIQFIDNHFIVPNIVASKVKINALVSIVVVLAGGALWGVPGMFVSIPLTAIIKVIFDHIEPLKPWGFVLGNTVPTNSKFAFNKPKKVNEKLVVTTSSNK